jgi:hypothetical protein
VVLKATIGDIAIVGDTLVVDRIKRSAIRHLASARVVSDESGAMRFAHCAYGLEYNDQREA